MSYARLALTFLLSLPLCGSAQSLSSSPDPHYNEVGFFDVHVCNWPDRPLFFMALFSTTRFAEVQEVAVSDPTGRPIGKLDLGKYNIVRSPGKPEKRVFISHLDIPSGAANGWYEARIILNDGKMLTAKDFVYIDQMPLPQGFKPEEGGEISEIPATLSWNTVPGAKFYRVFIRNLWTGESVYQSKVLSEPRVALPPELLRRGESYSWKVHARDVHEDALWGDFNLGTLSRDVVFSITP